MGVDGVEHAGSRFFDPLVFRQAGLNLNSRLPEAPDLRLSLWSNTQQVSGLERPDPFENRARRQRVTKAEEVINALAVDVEPVIREGS